jgi:hypothetical protein
MWSAEAEVIATYWDSPVRNTVTDQRWLLRQIHKELLDGVAPNLQRITAGFKDIHTVSGRQSFRRTLGVLQDEFEHFAGFAALYESLTGGAEPCPNAETLRREGGWPENDVLMNLRASHCQQFGMLGLRATRFTEGGYCTLFSEGMKLKHRGGFDARIADLCTVIYADEFEHMLGGIADLGDSNEMLSAQEWQTLGSLAMAQLQARIHMRNAQFSYPVSAERLAAILNGACAPMPFDYDAFAIATEEF